jgi:hypothetical protein
MKPSNPKTTRNRTSNKGMAAPVAGGTARRCRK